MGSRIRIPGGFFLFLALLLLTIPIRWILAAFIAALLHELGHYLAVRLFGGTLVQISVSARGAKMEVSPMSPGRQLLSTLAGPMVSLGLMTLARIFPRIAICGLLQGAYNLLPLPWLDGGRAIGCMKVLAARYLQTGEKTPCKDSKHAVQ